MSQKLFDGKPSPPRQRALLTENAWTLSESQQPFPHPIGSVCICDYMAFKAFLQCSNVWEAPEIKLNVDLALEVYEVFTDAAITFLP